ncbi:gamma-glutamylcyclotransferase [Pleurocapsales cyanobacterium LEGE 06147]|nr:gamma-glutamylcyclotransferase [Pleurocapsales cyanobacterium LEGE 06147]
MSQTQQKNRRVFICGSALRGQPDHQNLQSAQFIKEAATQSLYRLHAAGDGWHPAIYKVAEGGISIPGEVYELTALSKRYDRLRTYSARSSMAR